VITGETGTGKGLVARLLHQHAAREGAFTGATDGGALFLDELQDLSAEVQRSLLLFLDGHGFAPLGTYRRIHTEVRLISAAQRPEDVEPIAKSVLRRHPGRGPDGKGARLSARTLALLVGLAWPGNVRELAAAVDTAAWMALGGETIEPEHLPERPLCGRRAGTWRRRHGGWECVPRPCGGGSRPAAWTSGLSGGRGTSPPARPMGSLCV
jgi:two-component system NtrC family response regulator